MKADLQKHTLHLRLGDWAFLESVYKLNGLATSVIVRTLVSKHVDELRAKEKAPELEMDVTL